MSNWIADKEVRSVIHRLKLAVDGHELSLRALCEKTLPLDPPERFGHSQVSSALLRKRNRNFYFQQVLVLCKLLGRDLISFLVDTDDVQVANNAALVARAFVAMPPKQRADILKIVQSGKIEAEKAMVASKFNDLSEEQRAQILKIVTKHPRN